MIEPPTTMRAWDSLKCPLPGCRGELYLIRTECFPVLTDAQPEDFSPGGGNTSSWSVECSEDLHKIMSPTRHINDNEEFAQPCDQCAEEGDVHDDIADLRNLVDRLRSAVHPPLGGGQS